MGDAGRNIRGPMGVGGWCYKAGWWRRTGEAGRGSLTRLRKGEHSGRLAAGVYTRPLYKSLGEHHFSAGTRAACAGHSHMSRSPAFSATITISRNGHLLSPNTAIARSCPDGASSSGASTLDSLTKAQRSPVHSTPTLHVRSHSVRPAVLCPVQTVTSQAPSATKRTIFSPTAAARKHPIICRLLP